MSTWYKIAIACGLLPLVAGTITFVAWLMSYQYELMLVGYYVILGGLVCFLVGVITLCRYFHGARKAGDSHVRPTVIGAAILLLNFPVAFAYLAVVGGMETGILLTIKNDSSAPIRNFVLIDPRGKNYPVVDIKPHSTYSSCFDLRGEGGVKYSMSAGKISHEGYLIDYITSNSGVSSKMHFTESGRIEISTSYDRISFGKLRLSCSSWG